MNTHVLVFDIETIPDTTAGRQLLNLSSELSDTEVAEAMFTKRREETNGSDFLRLHVQRVAAISVVLANANKVSVWSIGDENSSEADIIQRFFDGIEKYTPTVVSWNGSGFDFPVLHYRALVNNIVAPRYWDVGETDSNFRWNNYINRYHYRHLDLMDVLACYQAKANAPLDEIASMLGCPGKMGMSGSKVWEYFQAGKLKEIRDYCETDVLNTYLVYLQFELMRGKITFDELMQRKRILLDYLQKENKAHFEEFVGKWRSKPE